MRTLHDGASVPRPVSCLYRSVALGAATVALLAVAASASADPPPKPTAVSPLGNTYDPQPSYTWEPSVGATGYDIQAFDCGFDLTPDDLFCFEPPDC